MVKEPLEKKTIVLSTGGTGGHVFPAIALGDMFKAEGYRVLYVSDRRGSKYLEPVVKADELVLVPIAAFQGGIMAKISYVKALFNSMKRLKPLYKRQNVSAVIGFGGYASLPGLLTGWFCGLPVFAHEQNAVASKVTRLSSLFVRRVFSSTRQVRKIPFFAQSKILFAGMPIRVLTPKGAEATFPHNEKLKILVLGGSQGAGVFSRVVPTAIGSLPIKMQRSVSVVQQVGEGDIPALKKFYQEHAIDAILAPFFYDVYTHMQNADLIISRAGASSVAEITHFEKPAILVPFPRAADDHQTANAEEIVSFGGGWLLPENGSLEKKMTELIKNLLHERKALSLASSNLSRLKKPNAAKDIVQMVLRSQDKRSGLCR